MILLGILLSCSPSPQPSPDEAQEPGSAAAPHEAVPLTDLQRSGRMIYETLCWTCHGEAGRGDGPAVQAGKMTRPPSFLTQDYVNSSAERLRRRFTAELGEADPEHPHMQYVASIVRPEKFVEALAFIPALGYPPEIPGSALAGERIYGFRCVACHGVDGRGHGPAAASLVAMKPADFTRDTLIAKGDWDGLFRRITEGGQRVHGSSMPPWGVVLSEAEIWDLVAYLATFQPGVLGRPNWIE